MPKYSFNTIYIVGWNRGYTQYYSEVMKNNFGTPVDPAFSEFDPIKYLIQKARPKGIKIILWFEFGFSYRYKNETNSEIERRKPHWISINRQGAPVEKNGFYWLNAFDPEVQKFMIDLISEAVHKYDIDGIQGDDRLPALPSSAGYNRGIVEDFFNQYSYSPSDDKDTLWVQFRADKLTDFLGNLYKHLKSIRPDLIISMSPSIYPWSLNEYLQDWPRWISDGLVDELLPQVYRRNLAAYQSTLNNNVLKFIPDHFLNRLFPGILLKINDYYTDDQLLFQKISFNRSKGIKGEVFFYFEGIKKRPKFFKGYSKAF
ncbi:MAG: glycoside hydrolase family 10 protein [Cyclobacteriaceae bacterium]